MLEQHAPSKSQTTNILLNQYYRYLKTDKVWNWIGKLSRIPQRINESHKRNPKIREPWKRSWFNQKIRELGKLLWQLFKVSRIKFNRQTIEKNLFFAFFLLSSVLIIGLGIYIKKKFLFDFFNCLGKYLSNECFIIYPTKGSFKIDNLSFFAAFMLGKKINVTRFVDLWFFVLSWKLLYLMKGYQRPPFFSYSSLKKEFIEQSTFPNPWLW